MDKLLSPGCKRFSSRAQSSDDEEKDFVRSVKKSTATQKINDPIVLIFIHVFYFLFSIHDMPQVRSQICSIGLPIVVALLIGVQ